MADLKLYELPPSPNNVKARIALNYKGLQFERIPVDPMNRTPVVEVSGQPLTPVLVHKGAVICDSGAILRYLDANFRDTQPLWSSNYDEAHEIEEWELWAKTKLSEPVGLTFREALSGEPDPGVLLKACDLMTEAGARLEHRLTGNEWLVGERMTAADVSCAPLAFLAMISDQGAAQSPILAFFKENLHLGEGREKTRAWVERVMAYA